MAELAYLIRFNFVYSPLAMDQDAAKLMTHMIEIVRTGRLLIPDWRYMTTHEIDSAMLLAIPFYTVTKNVYLSFALSNTIYMFVLLAVLLSLMKNCGMDTKISLLVCCFIYVPYSYGMLDYLNMLFIRGGQYSIKILIPLLALLLITFPEKKPKRDFTLLALWLFLVFLSAFSSGLFPFVTGILPIAGAYFVNAFFRKNSLQEVSAFRTTVLVSGSVLSIAGFAVHQYCNISPSGMDALLIRAGDFGQRVFTNIAYFFAVINALPTMFNKAYTIMNLEGVGYVARFVFAVFLLVSGIRCVVSFFRDKESNASFGASKAVSGYMAAIIMVNALIHLLSSYNFPRYYLVEVICMMILAGMMLNELAAHLEKRGVIALWVLLCIGVLGIWYTSKKYVEVCLEVNNTYGYCYALSDFIRAQNVDNVIMIDNSEADEICRLFLIEDTQVANYLSEDGTFISYDWYTYTGERSYYGDTSIIVTDTYDDLTPLFGEEAASKYVYLGQIDSFFLFRADEFCLPIQ